MTHLNFSTKNLLLLFIVLGASIKKLFTLNFECRIWNAFYWFSNCVKKQCIFGYISWIILSCYIAPMKSILYKTRKTSEKSRSVCWTMPVTTSRFFWWHFTLVPAFPPQKPKTHWHQIIKKSWKIHSIKIAHLIDNCNKIRSQFFNIQAFFCIEKVQNVSKPVCQNTPRYSWGKVVASFGIVWKVAEKENKWIPKAHEHK